MSFIYYICQGPVLCNLYVCKTRKMLLKCYIYRFAEWLGSILIYLAER